MKRINLFIAALFCCILCNAEVKEPNTYNYHRGIEALRDGETDKVIDSFYK